MTGFQQTRPFSPQHGHLPLPAEQVRTGQRPVPEGPAEAREGRPGSGNGDQLRAALLRRVLRELGDLRMRL